MTVRDKIYQECMKRAKEANLKITYSKPPSYWANLLKNHQEKNFRLIGYPDISSITEWIKLAEACCGHKQTVTPLEALDCLSAGYVFEDIKARIGA